MTDSKKKRADEVRRIVASTYEPGRQDRCKMWVWRNVVRPGMGISAATFFRYLKEEDAPGDNNKNNDGYPSLFG